MQYLSGFTQKYQNNLDVACSCFFKILHVNGLRKFCLYYERLSRLRWFIPFEFWRTDGRCVFAPIRVDNAFAPTASANKKKLTGVLFLVFAFVMSLGEGFAQSSNANLEFQLAQASSSRTSTRNRRSSASSSSAAQRRSTAARSRTNTANRSSGSRRSTSARKSKRRRSSTKRRGKKRSSKSSLGQFKLRADPSISVFYIDPPDITVPQGEEFVTFFRLNNPQYRKFDRIYVALRYDRDVVKPLAVSDAALKGTLARPSQAKVQPRKGTLTYAAELSVPFSTINDVIFTIRWKALQLSSRAMFEFISTQEQNTGMWLGKEDILGTPEETGDGLINGSIHVISQDTYKLMLANRSHLASSHQEIEEISFDEVPGGTGGIRLQLVGPKKPIRVGASFDVDLVFDNRADSLIDGVSVYIDFDPEVLRPIDIDQDNWITRGMNILDGPYRNRFPFDFHTANQVYPNRGEIVYRVGIGDAERLRHRVGTMATLRFRAIAPAPSTSIRFKLPEGRAGSGTRLTYLGEPVLGNPEKGVSGVQNIALKVLN